jgi:hypothetical protein
MADDVGKGVAEAQVRAYPRGTMRSILVILERRGGAQQI